MDQGFGYDKPAQTPCINLQPDFRCSIHGRLAESGFPGCIAFDCYGAGQWVTQQVFQGASWRDSVLTGKRMFEAFSRFRTLHELMALLIVARQHVKEKDILEKLDRKLKEIEKITVAETADCGRIEITTLRQEIMGFLREHVSLSKMAGITGETGALNGNRIL